MKNLLSITEIVDSYLEGHTEWDVCATAETKYDEGDHLLIVELGSFVRGTLARLNSTYPRPEWLPQPEVVKERLPLNEATAEAREIFQSWANKVRHMAAHKTLQTT